MEKKTALYDCHLAAGGKMVPFAGYLLPVQYQNGVIQEHLAVRQAAGLFDVSHMGEVTLCGPDALANLQHLLTNDYDNLQDGFVRYSPMCYENGGVVDDLLVYKLGENNYFLVVNAANKEKDVSWLREHVFGNVQLEDISENISQLALQGPRAVEILQTLTTAAEIPARYYSFTEKATVAGIPCLLSRTGYTGEDGFELYCANADAPQLWQALLAAGEPQGLVPCGLGARDTLRLEAAMPLYGHEMDADTTPLETGLGFFVKMSKQSFIGKEAMQASAPRTRIGLKITGRGIAREHCPVYSGGKQIGVTTSGTHAPFLGQAIAMALVEAGEYLAGQALEVEVRGKRLAAETVALPFYKRPK